MLARAARTCSEWNRLTNDHTIWSGLFLRKWGQLPDDGDYLEAAIDMTLHNIQNANVFKHCYKLKKLRLINHPKTYGKNQSYLFFSSLFFSLFHFHYLFDKERNEKAVEYNNNNNDYQPIVPEDLHLIDRELSPPPKRVKTSKSIIAKRAMVLLFLFFLFIFSPFLFSLFYYSFWLWFNFWIVETTTARRVEFIPPTTTCLFC